MAALPHSEQHEYGLLSCCIQDPLVSGKEALDAFSDENPFYLPECALVWSAFQRIDLDKINQLTISDFLGERLPMTKLLEIGRAQPSIAGFKTHLDWVRKLFAQRGMIARLTLLTDALYDNKARPDDISRDIVDAVGNVMCERHEIATVGEAIDSMVENYTSNTIGSSTGFHALDRVLAPIPPGALTIIAARPKVGKSALAVCQAINLAQQGIPVGIISMEMPKEQLCARMVASTACVSSRPQDLKYNIDKEHCVKSMDLLRGLPIFIEDSLHDWKKIKRAIRSLHNKHGIKHWFIDHIGLVRYNGKAQNREREIAEISGDCKQMALEMRGWFFVLSQLNRNAEGVMPQLHHLRESGSLEQDADAVVFLHYKRQDTHDEFMHIQNGGWLQTTAKVAANRHGPTGPVQMRFYPKYSLFDNRIVNDNDIQE